MLIGVNTVSPLIKRVKKESISSEAISLAKAASLAYSADQLDNLFIKYNTICYPASWLVENGYFENKDYDDENKARGSVLVKKDNNIISYNIWITDVDSYYASNISMNDMNVNKIIAEDSLSNDSEIIKNFNKCGDMFENVRDDVIYMKNNLVPEVRDYDNWETSKTNSKNNLFNLNSYVTSKKKIKIVFDADIYNNVLTSKNELCSNVAKPRVTIAGTSKYFNDITGISQKVIEVQIDPSKENIFQVSYEACAKAILNTVKIVDVD